MKSLLLILNSCGYFHGHMGKMQEVHWWWNFSRDAPGFINNFTATWSGELTSNPIIRLSHFVLHLHPSGHHDPIISHRTSFPLYSHIAKTHRSTWTKIFHSLTRFPIVAVEHAFHRLVSLSWKIFVSWVNCSECSFLMVKLNIPLTAQVTWNYSSYRNVDKTFMFIRWSGVEFFFVPPPQLGSYPSQTLRQRATDE